MDKLKTIINDLNEVRKEGNLQIDDKTLFEQAVDIFISNNINEANIKQYVKKQDPINKILPATIKQKWKLKQLGIKFKPEITKQEAFTLIKEKSE